MKQSPGMTLAEARQKAQEELEKSGLGLLQHKHSRARHEQMSKALEKEPPPKVEKVRAIR